MSVLDVKMGHALLGVFGLFCEYICDFLCDCQYLYQCGSCVDVNCVAVCLGSDWTIMLSLLLNWLLTH